jgi:hypothetical protein
MFDPLYNWSLTPAKAYKLQYGREPGPALRKQWDKSAEESKGQKANKLAERALLRVTHKLNGMEEGSHLSVQGQVNQRNLIIFRKDLYYISTSCGRVVRDFEREAKTRCNFQFR